MNAIKSAAAGAAAIVALLGLGGCAEAGLSPGDAYAIGCPAVDSAVATGSVANKATLTGLRALRDAGQLDQQSQAWVEATIAVLENPNDVPDDARQLIIKGCADHGQPLKNLR